MRFTYFAREQEIAIAVARGDALVDVSALDLSFALTPLSAASLDPGQRGEVQRILDGYRGPTLSPASLRRLPPVAPTARIFCVGLNYADHADESRMDKPAHPVVFLRTYDSFVGHDCPIVKPIASDAFDYEGEMVAVLARGGRRIAAQDAPACIGAYSVANEGSIRDYQLQRGPQWTMGKNFHASGAIGPQLVTADEVPLLGKGLAISTSVNGEVVQHSNTAQMIFDLSQIIAYLSEAFVLRAGDVIVSGTPAGVGAARTPPLFVKAGDVVEVQVEGIGKLLNRVENEAD